MSRRLPLAVALSTGLLCLGCLRSYNVSPLSPASLNKVAVHESGIELRTKAFLAPNEVADRFGSKLAEDRQVIPVQVLVTNKSKDPYRVLRASFILEEQEKKVRLEALTPDQMYDIGRHGYGAPVCGIIFGGILGLPSLITTMNANNKLQMDYQQKVFVDAIVDPAKDVVGAVLFNPEPAGLTRASKYHLLIEFENVNTKVKFTLDQAL